MLFRNAQSVHRNLVPTGSKFRRALFKAFPKLFGHAVSVQDTPFFTLYRGYMDAFMSPPPIWMTHEVTQAEQELKEWLDERTYHFVIDWDRTANNCIYFMHEVDAVDFKLRYL